MGRTIAFIPARGGSKGIPDKNIRLLNGRPMICYTVTAALESSADVVVVSSDSERIHSIVREEAAANNPSLLGRLAHHRRPADLAGDEAPISAAVSHFLETTSDLFEFIVLLQPTSPVRGKGHIDEALSLLRKSGKNTVCAVSDPMQHPADMICRSHERYDFLLKREGEVQRQSYEKVLFIVGSIYAARMDYFQRTRRFFDPDNSEVLVTNGIYSIDVDTPDQLFIADAVLRNLNEFEAIVQSPS